VSRYLHSTDQPRLHFGAGPVRLPGWLDTDLISGDIYLDVTRTLPLPSDSFAYAFGEHVIEHISERSGMRLLGDLRRVLRPGGTLRLTTPDLPKMTRRTCARSCWQPAFPRWSAWSRARAPTRCFAVWSGTEGPSG
jgi:predicted SAM-dependent methyltransferase